MSPDVTVAEPGRSLVRHIKRGLSTDAGAVQVLSSWFTPQPVEGVNGLKGWQSATYEERGGEEGPFTIRFPNTAGADGVLHRDRFLLLTDPYYKIGDEWLEFYEVTGSSLPGRLLYIGTPTKWTINRATIEISGYDAWRVLQRQRESAAGVWPAAAPSEILQHYAGLWTAEVSEDFEDDLTAVHSVPALTAAVDDQWRCNVGTGNSEVVGPRFAHRHAYVGPKSGAIALVPSNNSGNSVAYVRTLLDTYGQNDVSDPPLSIRGMRIEADLEFKCLTAGQSTGGQFYGIRFNAQAGKQSSAVTVDGMTFWIGRQVTVLPSVTVRCINAAGAIQPATLPPDVVGRGLLVGAEKRFTFALEMRDKYYFAYIDNYLVAVGEFLKTGTINGNSQAMVFCNKPVTEASGSGVLYVHNFQVKRWQPWLRRGSENIYSTSLNTSGAVSDMRIPGAPVAKGLKWNMFDENGNIAAGGSVQDRTLVPTTGQDGVRTIVRHLGVPSFTGIGSTSYWPIPLPTGGPNTSMRIHGSVKLDLTNYDYLFNATCDDRVRLWALDTRSFGNGVANNRRYAALNLTDWGTGHPMTHSYGLWLKSGASGAFPSVGAIGPGALTGGVGFGQGDGYFPLVIEYSNTNSAGGLVLRYARSDRPRLFTVLGSSAYARAVAELNTVAYWPLNEGVSEGAANGTAALQAVSATASDDGVLTNFAGSGVQWVPGFTAGEVALDLNGTTQYVTAPNNTAYNCTTQMSVGCWFNADSVTGIGNLIRKEDPNSVWGLRRNGATLDFFHSVGGVIVSVSGGTIATGTWYHGMATWDGSSLRLYLNGVLVAGPTARTGTKVAGTVAVSIGASGTSGVPSEWFDGRMQHASIHSVGLSATQVAALHKAGSQPDGALLSPQGTVQQTVRFDSHYEQLRNLRDSLGLQMRLEAQSLESGYFPGQISYGPSLGRATDMVITASNAMQVQATGDAEDGVSSLMLDGSGLADSKNTAQITKEALSFVDARNHLHVQQDYQSLGDITDPALLEQRGNAMLALRLSPWQEVSARPTNRRAFTDTFPLTGALADFNWRPYDGVRLQIPEVYVNDQSTRQVLGVSWPLVPDGIGKPSVSFRQRPRDLRTVLRDAQRQAVQQARNYQGQLVTLTSNHGAWVGTTAGGSGGGDQFARLNLPPVGTIVKVEFIVSFKTTGGPSQLLEVNTIPTGTGALIAAPAVTITTPGRYDITAQAALALGAQTDPQQLRRLLCHLAGAAVGFNVTYNIEAQVVV